MRWFKVLMNTTEAFMRVNGDVVEYFALDGTPLVFTEGTVHVIENDVTGPV